MSSFNKELAQSDSQYVPPDDFFDDNRSNSSLGGSSSVDNDERNHGFLTQRDKNQISSPEVEISDASIIESSPETENIKTVNIAKVSKNFILFLVYL